ncbi:MAG: NADH-quinone oxidoreductase subunit A [Pirellulales bacterium]|nr:NADH-quinone oxidoreductase subunit A [Pirellulales bacterium]
MQMSFVPILLLPAVTIGLAVVLLLVANLLNPKRPGRVKRMPYESGMDPIHDTRRRFGVHFHLLAIAFLVFDVELLFLYPWAVAMRPAARESVTANPPIAHRQADVLQPPVSDMAGKAGIDWTPRPAFLGGMVLILLLTLGFVYDWRKGIFQWR